MKKYLSLVLLLGISTSCFCQEMKISSRALPAVVIQAFRSAYPGAKIKGATKELNKGETTYEISCKDSLGSHTISLTADGKITETEMNLTVDKLPDPVVQAISKQYTKGKILRIEMSVKESGTVYEVLIRDKKNKFEVVFSPDGSVVKAN